MLSFLCPAIESNYIPLYLTVWQSHNFWSPHHHLCLFYMWLAVFTAVLQETLELPIKNFLVIYLL